LPLQFGSSGIRGKYGDTITPETSFELGSILGDVLGPRLALGNDPRLSGPTLRAAFVSSALESGVEITDYGLIPTPALAYQTVHTRGDGGVMITASHNPIAYNGFKIFNAKGESLEDSSTLQSSTKKPRASAHEWSSIRDEYPEDYERRLSTIKFNKKWRVILDPGNGATSRLAPRIYRGTVSKATAINSHPDGRYPGRGPEPTRESLTMLSRVVSETKADIGIAFDGDGDRFYIVDEKGECPLQDRILASYVSFLSRESKGPFLVPVDASMAVDEAVARNGATLIRGPVGDAKLLAEMKKEKASFAGEPSGAWIHGDFHPCPDGLLSGLLYLKQLEQLNITVSSAVTAIPEYHMVRKSVAISKKAPNVNVRSLSLGLEKIVGPDSNTDSRYGIRVSSPASWVLVRESGTEPVVRVTAESKDAASVKRIVKDTLELINRLFKGRD
jgi:phosphomannomutase